MEENGDKYVNKLKNFVSTMKKEVNKSIGKCKKLSTKTTL